MKSGPSIYASQVFMVFSCLHTVFCSVLRNDARGASREINLSHKCAEYPYTFQYAHVQYAGPHHWVTSIYISFLHQLLTYLHTFFGNLSLIWALYLYMHSFHAISVFTHVICLRVESNNTLLLSQ